VSSAPTRSPTERPVPTPVRAVLVIGLLYLFLVGISLLESGIAGLGGEVQGELFASVTNPIAGLCVGILATVLAQSSSVTTATVVGLVGGGLIGVDQAVPIIMGANIGTTVTNTMASVGHIRRPREFRNSFAAATVHDLFNILSVSILLPVELLTGVLSESAEWISERLVGTGGATYESPLRQMVRGPAGVVADLWGAVASDTLLGVLLIATGLVAIFIALAFITKNMRRLVAARVERSLNAMLGRGAGVPAILLGIVITVAVQSSSITTSVLVPMAAAGVITLRNVYPVSLGANVGTTITALLASLAASRPEALTVALVHTIFNLVGILIFYPVPALRDIPVRLAERVADLAVSHRSRVAGYVFGVFILIPALGVILLR
jgi:solute carrier family 34 (sodium-dependent phosphate cotransporter)